MRCVSKSWNALLSHPSFIKSHLHHSINNNDRILLAFYDKESSSSDPKPFIAHPSRSLHLELTNFIKLPKSEDTTSTFIIVGSVHGLICSQYGYDVVHIWNPSLSAVSTLPPHYIPSHDSYEITFRFGFDPKTEDYKVIKVIGRTRPPRSGTLSYVVTEWLQVEVYSMKKGSWEFITQRFPSHVTNIFDDDTVCVDGHDGHLHWFCYTDEEEGLETIVAFDLASETFCEIALPDSVLDGTRSNALAVLDGKLCVVSWYEGDDVFEVWVMDEYGVAQSWFKRHFFSQFIDEIVCGITSHNEILMVNDDFHIVLYDPIAHNAKFLGKNCHGNDSIDKFVEYIDSLVWVAPVEREIVDDAGEY